MDQDLSNTSGTHTGGPYDLFIRVEQGTPVFYPSTRENITLAFPDANLDDPDNSVPRFEKAKIIPYPDEWIDQEYKVWEEIPYQFDGEYWKNGWTKRDMTPKEKLETDINLAVGNKKTAQIKKFLETRGITDIDSQEAFDALNEVGPEYVFSLDV